MGFEDPHEIVQVCIFTTKVVIGSFHNNQYMVGHIQTSKRLCFKHKQLVLNSNRMYTMYYS